MLLTKLFAHFQQLLPEVFAKSNSIFFFIVKIALPVSFIVLFLEEVGAVSYLSGMASPLFQALQLPAASSLSFVSGLFINIYTAVIIALQTIPESEITVAQASALGMLILFCHNVLIEVVLCRHFGLRALPLFLWRLLTGLFSVFVFLQFCAYFDFWQAQAEFVQFDMPVDQASLSLLDKSIGILWNLVQIYIILLCLILLLEYLRIFRIEQAIHKLIAPFLPVLGLPQQAAQPVAVGLLLGLAYGGGVFMSMKLDRLFSPKQMLLLFYFLSIFHSVIEDSLLVMVLGGAFVPIVIIRFGLSVFYMLLLHWLCEFPWCLRLLCLPEVRQTPHVPDSPNSGKNGGQL